MMRLYEGVYNEVYSHSQVSGGPDWVMMPIFTGTIGILVATLI